MSKMNKIKMEIASLPQRRESIKIIRSSGRNKLIKIMGKVLKANRKTVFLRIN